jgi:putative acyl-CoA dehydrogenase
MVFCVADALDRAADAALFVRLATALGKFWICKRAPQHINEAQECLGGLGYIEDNILPRLYREAPVNSIWEGSGNVQCLDVQRTLQKDPETLVVFRGFLHARRGQHARFDVLLREFDKLNVSSATEPLHARSHTAHMALLLQARLMLEFAPENVADTFIDSRFNPATLTYGGLRNPAPFEWLLQRFELPGGK